MITTSIQQVVWLDFRRELWERDKGICGLCGDPVEFGADMHIDHIVSLNTGGGHSRENLQIAHSRCNLKKGDGTPRSQKPIKIKVTRPELPVTTDAGDLVTVDAVARVLRVKPKTVRRWIATGTIKRATMVTRRAGWLVPRSEVDPVATREQPLAIRACYRYSD